MVSVLEYEWTTKKIKGHERQKINSNKEGYY